MARNHLAAFAAVASLIACDGGSPPKAPSRKSNAAIPVTSADPPEPARDRTRSRVVALDDVSTPAALLSPDRARLARAVRVLPSGEAALVLHDLSSAVPSVSAKQLATSAVPVSFSGDKLIAIATDKHEAFVIDPRDRAKKSLGPADSFVMSPNGARLVLSTARGRVAGLSTNPLTESWALDAGAEARIQFTGDDNLFVDTKRSSWLVDAATGKRLIEANPAVGADWDTLFVARSRRSRWLAIHRSHGGQPAVAVVEVATGRTVTMITGSEIWHPAVAFSPDEKRAVASVSPGTIELIELPSGGRKRIPTGISIATVAYDDYTDQIAFTEDGSGVCLHPATSIGKYTGCEAHVAFDSSGKARRSSTNELVQCHFAGDTARIVRIPRRLLAPTSDGRVTIPSGSATYTKLCNGVVTPDGSRVAFVEARERDDTYVDPQLVVWDTTGGRIHKVIPFAATMPSVYGARLSIDIMDGVNGRIAATHFGDGSPWIDLERGAVVPQAPAPPSADRSQAVMIDDDLGKVVVSPAGIVVQPYSSRRAYELAQQIDALPEMRALAKRADRWEPIETPTGVRVFASKRRKNVRIAIAPLAEQAWIAWLPDGRAELLGDGKRARAAAERLLSCKRGDEFEPFSECEADAIASGEIAAVIARGY